MGGLQLLRLPCPLMRIYTIPRPGLRPGYPPRDFAGSMTPPCNPSLSSSISLLVFMNLHLRVYYWGIQCKRTISYTQKGIPRWHSGATVVKNLSATVEDARDMSSIPGSGRFPGVGNGNPLQYSCLENPVDRGAWRPTVHGVTNSWTRLSD